MIFTKEEGKQGKKTITDGIEARKNLEGKFGKKIKLK